MEIVELEVEQVNDFFNKQIKYLVEYLIITDD